jgi:hypothetical protein
MDKYYKLAEKAGLSGKEALDWASEKYEKDQQRSEQEKVRIAESEKLEIEKTKLEINLNAQSLELQRQGIQPVPLQQTPMSTVLSRPTAPLPRFGGSPKENYTLFIKEFEDILSNYKYSATDMFLLFRKQLDGNALTLIETLQFQDRNFDKAKELLDSIYSNTYIIKQHLINDIKNLSFAESDDPYVFLAKLKTIHQNITLNNLTIEDIFQHFAWRGINYKFQNILVTSTNEIHPKMDTIFSNFVKCTQRYQEQYGNKISNFNKSQKWEKSNVKVVSSINLNTNNKSKPNANKLILQCKLCEKKFGKSSHDYVNCKTFPDVKSKVNALDFYNGCTKCGNLTHTTSSCHYRFKYKCIHCKNWHMNFLCQNKNSNDKSSNFTPKNQNKTKKSTTSETVVNTVFIKSFSVQNKYKTTLLPTFTCRAGKDRKIIRVLKDGGSMASIISQKLVNKLNLPIIKSKEKTILTGINSSRTIDTFTTKIPLQIGRKTHIVKALVVPTIDMKTDYGHIESIVEAFRSKGHKLADHNLLNHKNKEIEFILGQDNNHLIMESDIKFGEGAIFSRTNMGIILKGNSSNYLKNLNKIPLNNSKWAKNKKCNLSCQNKDGGKAGVLHSEGLNNACYKTENTQSKTKNKNKNKLKSKSKICSAMKVDIYGDNNKKNSINDSSGDTRSHTPILGIPLDKPSGKSRSRDNTLVSGGRDISLDFSRLDAGGD